MQPTKLFEQIAQRYEGGGLTLSEAVRQVAEQGLSFATPHSTALYQKLLSDVARALNVKDDGRRTLEQEVDEAAKLNRSRKAIGANVRDLTAADFASLTETEKATAIALAAGIMGVA